MKNTLKPKARYAAILCLGLIPLTACTTGESTTVQTRKTVIALFEAFNAHDLDGVLALYHPDVMKSNPSNPEPRYGKEVVRRIYSGLFRQFPDVQDTIERIVCEGDRAAVEFTASWSLPGENGQVDRVLHVAAFLKLKNGRIVEDVTYYDQMSFSATPSD